MAVPVTDWNLCHACASMDGRVSKIVRIHGFKSGACRAWSDYRRSLFTLACALDLRNIVRMLVTELGVNTRVHESGLVLTNDPGLLHAWDMSRLDLCIEFGCERTLELLFKLSAQYPHTVLLQQYSAYGLQDCANLYTYVHGDMCAHRCAACVCAAHMCTHVHRDRDKRHACT